MNKITKDLIGQRFGRLVVLIRGNDYTEEWIDKNGKIIKNNRRTWDCLCDCGNIKYDAQEKGLKCGKVKSCGCLRKETSIANGYKQKKYNEYNLSGQYGIGYSSNGKEFYFDLEDYDKIKDYCWNVKNDYYVESHSPYSSNCILLHRLVMDEENEKIIIDHINHKPNDNRKINLRKVNHVKNMHNRKIPTNNTSGYIGVYKNGNAWRAELTSEGYIYGKTFKDKNEAVVYRTELENKYYGEYSYKNSMNMKENE